MSFSTQLSGRPSEALLLAVRQGRVEAVREALVQGADPEFTRTDVTALMMASEAGFTDVVACLLEYKADPMHGTRTRWTPLLEACRSNRVEVIPLLIDKLIFPNSRDDNGWNPVRAAVEGNAREALSVLRGTDISFNTGDNQGVTPLMVAVENRRSELVEALLQGGAEVEAKDHSGQSVRDRVGDWTEVLPLLNAGPAVVVAPAATEEATTVEAPATEAPAPKAGVSRIMKRPGR